MSSAGQQLVAGRIPGERIATTVETTDSTTFTTTETVVSSVTAPLISGRTYRVRFIGKFASTVADDQVVVTIRQDGVSGGIEQQYVMDIETTAPAGYGTPAEAEYTASSTSNKTFVVTGDRTSGSGSIHMEAASSRPCFLYVDYIRG